METYSKTRHRRARDKNRCFLGSPIRSRTPSADSNLSASADTSPVATCLFSPDIDSHESSFSRDGGFYLLRKDSERRTILVEILAQDMEKICQEWLKILRRDATISNPKLTTDHLQIMMLGMKRFIRDQSMEPLKNAFDQMRDGMEIDSSSLMEIQLALYLAHEAVSTILKVHNIKPHWMFALDNLIRSAVQAAITVLSPELGASLAGSALDDEVVTSGVSSANSAGKPLAYRKMAMQEFYKEYDRLQEDSVRMMQELMELQKSYQQMLYNTLQEKKNAISQLKIFQIQEGSNGERKLTDADTKRSGSVIQDQDLVSWLEQNHFDQDTVNSICEEEYTLQDLMELVTWEDLRQLNLRGGVRCRLWRTILVYRSKEQEDEV